MFDTKAPIRYPLTESSSNHSHLHTHHPAASLHRPCLPFSAFSKLPFCLRLVRIPPALKLKLNSYKFGYDEGWRCLHLASGGLC